MALSCVSPKSLTLCRRKLENIDQQLGFNLLLHFHAGVCNHRQSSYFIPKPILRDFSGKRHSNRSPTPLHDFWSSLPRNIRSVDMWEKTVPSPTPNLAAHTFLLSFPRVGDRRAVSEGVSGGCTRRRRKRKFCW